MMWQTIDVNVLMQQLLPVEWRAEPTLSLLQSFTKPLQELADKTLYQMQHDGRVIYLEKMLNEYFEVAGYDKNNHVATRKIYIQNAPQRERDYIYLSEEPETMWLFEEEDIEAEELIEYIDVGAPTTHHFIIMIPTTIAFDEPTLRPIIDFYVLAGKKYIIETYEED